MPVKFEIDEARSLVLTTVTGAVSAREMLAYHAALVADARFSPDFGILMEFREAATFDGTGNDIRLLAQSSLLGREARRAYVVANDLHFGLSRMAQEYADMVGAHAEVFRDRPSAMAWLAREVTES